MRAPHTKSGRIATKSWSRREKIGFVFQLTRELHSNINWFLFARALRHAVPLCGKTPQDCKFKFETMQDLHCSRAFDTDLDVFHTFDPCDNAWDACDAWDAWDAWDASNPNILESELNVSCTESDLLWEPELERDSKPESKPELAACTEGSHLHTWLHSKDAASNYVQLETVPGLEGVPLMTVDEFQYTFNLASGV